MSLYLYLTEDAAEASVYEGRVTDNLTKMAREAGVYMPVWCPDEIGITRAEDLIAPLRNGLSLLRSDPKRFEALNASNGWGRYDQLVPFLEEYLSACEANPTAAVLASR